MSEQNTTFSSAGDMMKQLLIKSDEICEIHGTHKIAVRGKEAVCIECGQEEIDRNNKAYRDDVSERYYNRKEYEKYDWLDKYSLTLDSAIKKARFATFDVVDAETNQNKAIAQSIAESVISGKTSNVILTGKPGTGKSHLAMSIIQEVNERSKPRKKCLFASIDEVARRARYAINNKDSEHSEESLIDAMSEVDVLVIDDLGAETGSIGTDKQASDFITRILYATLNARTEKPTIVTTNLTSKDIQSMYDEKIVSRMMRGVKNNVIIFKETSDKRMNVEF